jgi:hypothetical protein
MSNGFFGLEERTAAKAMRPGGGAKF